MNFKEHLPGISIVLFIALFSYGISTFHASFDPLVISIIAGMFIGNLAGRGQELIKGVESSVRIFIPSGIALYGTQVTVSELQWGTFWGIFAVFAALFSAAMFFSKVFSLDRRLALLLASGLSICGASAIAVISPVISAKREETSIAILSVMMLGLTGIVFYPILFDFWAVGNDEFSFYAGTTLPMLGQVKVAAANACPPCLATALKIKLIRISFLVFVVAAAVLLSKNEEKKIKIPWFIFVFFLFALLGNLTGVFRPYMQQLGAGSSFFLSAGLAAIGFSVDFDSIAEKGGAPLGVILISWILVLLSIYVVRNILHV